MHEIAQVRVRYGYWRIFTLLRREGWPDNHKRTVRRCGLPHLQRGRAKFTQQET